jgi:hypothetical protein
MRRACLLFAVAACADPPQAPAPITVVASEAGVPRLAHVHGTPMTAAPTAAAIAQLPDIASAYGVHALAELAGAGEVRVAGGTIARVRQSLDGVPIEDGELRLFVEPSGALAVASGALVDRDTPRDAFGRLDEPRALAAALHHIYGNTGATVSRSRTQRVWHRTGDRLAAAWVVEMFANRNDAWRTVVGDDGHILAHRSLVADAQFKYRVWAETTGELHPFDGPTVDPSPHPTGMPDGKFPAFVAPNLVTVDSLDQPGDPWLPAGATETNGNNCDAYTDANAPDGLTDGDFRATVTAPGVFDRTYDLAGDALVSQPQQMAAITSLFYDINWLHDFWYDAGFTETAGNGQASNYMRGGVEGDPVLAEAEDDALGGSINNANMATPADGMSPKMQVFIWSGTDDKTLTVGGTQFPAGAASYGPASFDATGATVIAAPADACAALTSTITGKIAIVDRGTCSFASKTLRVQQAGGVGMILVDNMAQQKPPPLGGDPTIMDTITIGSLSVTMADGATIKAQAGAAATLHRLAGPHLDGALDSTIVAHEFGHYIHHRLSVCGTKMCGALSEGWADFDALLLMVRAGDSPDGAYPIGVYATKNFSQDAAYFGIRRSPYSRSKAINALTFQDMSEGVTLPMTAPIVPFNSNSEIHNAGEIWAETLFSAYMSLQAEVGDFETARRRMQQYIVAGLLLAPVDATPTETRDALLQAAFMANQADHDALLAGFADRGMGSCAESPPRASIDFTGIVENADMKGRALPLSIVFDDSPHSCDQDGILDAGETARVAFTIANPGHRAVGDVNVTVSSATPGVTVLSGPFAIGTMQPYTSMPIEVEIELDKSARGPIAGDLSIDVTSTGGCHDTLTTPIPLRMNTDEKAASSTTDTFDTVQSVWTATGNGAWAHVQRTALDGFWLGTDLGTGSDSAVQTPSLHASGNKSLVVTFDHRYSFETGAMGNFDGGVIELSVDNGQTWNDIETLGVQPGYTGQIIKDGGNPLSDRNAFTGNSPGYPDTANVTLDFGKQLAGMDFLLRFRIGTDPGVGAPGWELDNVKFAGIDGKPFPTVIADAGKCRGAGGGCCDAGPMPSSSGALALGVLALLVGRRRKSA